MPIEWGGIELGIEVVTRAWDAIKNRDALYSTERFIKAHQENLEKSIDNLQDISSHTPEVLRAGVRETLKMMAAVVKANTRNQNVEINANYMIPLPPSEALMERAKFRDKKRRHDSYACFLELQMWAHEVPDRPDDVVLPVDKSTADMLFGAPRAYATGKPQVILNTKTIHRTIPKKTRKATRQEVENYFAENRAHIRSFVSLPIHVPAFSRADAYSCAGSDVIAVVNLQSSRTAVSGVFKGNQRKMEIQLAPFVHILAHHVLRLHYLKPATS